MSPAGCRGRLFPCWGVTIVTESFGRTDKSGVSGSMGAWQWTVTLGTGASVFVVGLIASTTGLGVRASGSVAGVGTSTTGLGVVASGSVAGVGTSTTGLGVVASGSVAGVGTSTTGLGVVASTTCGPLPRVAPYRFLRKAS